MAHYTFTIDMPSSQDIEKMVNGIVLPKVTQAVQEIAEIARGNWQDAVNNARLWSGEKKPYIASIKVQMTGPFSAVVSTDYQYADEIENGRPSRDLKKMLDTSTKVRRTKDGRRFLVIPMRHNTPGNDAHAPSMSAAVHAIAKKLSLSSVRSSGQRPSGEVTLFSGKSGMQAACQQTPFMSHLKGGAHYLVNKSHYAWGGRLTPAMLHGQAKPDQWKYAGMARFKNATGGSTYMTFRIMMEGSSGWVVPAQPGKYLARNVAEGLAPLADTIMSEAFKGSV